VPAHEKIEIISYAALGKHPLSDEFWRQVQVSIIEIRCIFIKLNFLFPAAKRK
jgi:hypothetical protein